ncbi:4'-phosphopantetheinyl transferase family protein [Kitasatospora sp. LaBMicrA B282]|uniref:4'-phosphopantetheinyl transferase family protein n=1 Tax=Kitasatospora sp. LaBMicrA B282 TaxID=3420949 RepID=UPI003D1187D8
MLADLLPPGAACAEYFADLPEAPLFPAEEQLLGDAVPKRRGEFGTARVAARAALAQLGLPPVAVLADPRGVPVWPDGVLGSITHCVGYRGCAVARSAEFAGLGIDAEPDLPLPPGLSEVITVPAERRHLAELARLPGPLGGSGRPAWDRLLFSAKEAVFKAVFPVSRIELDFPDVPITVVPGSGTFAAELPAAVARACGNRSRHLTGRWLAARGLLLTVVALGPV